MWERREFGGHVDKKPIGRLRWFRRQQRNTERLRQVAFGDVTFSLCPLSDSSFELQQAGFLGGEVPKEQTVPRAELWGAFQVLGRLNEKTHIQLPIDAIYVTKGVTHRSELKQGANGDLWSIIFQLIHERIGNTNIPEVKSLWDDTGPASTKSITSLQILRETL